MVRLGLRLHEKTPGRSLQDMEVGHSGSSVVTGRGPQMGSGHDRYHRAITQATCRPH